MRNEDASQAGLNESNAINARDDADHLAAKDFGPATGNLITGAGTINGSAGTDMGGAEAHIVAVEGSGGSDTTFSSGKLEVAGQYGTLTIDADGNYSYVRNAGTPAGVSDVFTYTLQAQGGASDTARLIINIGDVPMLATDGTRVVPGPDGVVVLPAGVELSDVRVVGRDLVVTLPDGSTMVIVDGAIFVPQLVLDGVEVPASNLAALLIGAEPTPAAGDLSPAQQSSGGNFALPPPPLDPGVPLGDLLPPTELGYTPPEIKEVNNATDSDPIAGVAAIQLDDDDVPGKNGNPGGPNDDAGSPNATGGGFLPGSDGDGSLTWALLASGAPSGFSYNLQPDGSIQVVQVQGGNNVVVLTISVNADTGAYVVTENNPIRHATGDTENNSIFVINYSVTDDDGDAALGTLTINVDDDTPTVTVSAGSDANVLLTTDDAQTIGAASDTAVSLADFSGVFGATVVSAGADGLGAGSSSSYTLNITGSVSGLSSHGSAINLFILNGVVVGTTGGQPASLADANIVFTVSVSNTGVVTLTQLQQIDHPIASDPTATGAPFADHIVSMADGLVTLTRSETVVDNDGDSVTGSASVNIGANLRFTDDGPTIDPTLNRGVEAAIVDESAPVAAASIPLVGGYTAGDDPDLAGGLAIGSGNTSGAVINANAAFGADGPANGGGISYALDVLNSVSGLETTEGVAINLVELSNGVVVGVVDGTTTVAFAIQINPTTGVVTVEQYLSINHPDSPDNYDEFLTLNEGSLGVTVTATDFDGDTATSPAVDITPLIHFHDDGPTLGVDEQFVSPLLVVDESPVGQDVGGDNAPPGDRSASASFAAAFIGGAFGADGPLGGTAEGGTSYALILSGEGIGSGIYALDPTDTSDAVDGIGQGDEILLYTAADGSIEGRVGGADGTLYFTISVDAGGVVTFTQVDGANVWHADTGSNDDTSSLILDGEGESLQLQLTLTDGDEDTAVASVDLSDGIFQIEDDGPSVPQVSPQNVTTLVVDESPIGQDEEGDNNPAGDRSASANFASAFGSGSFGTDGPLGGSGELGSSFALVLGSEGASSGLYALDPSDTSAVGDGIGQGEEILLYTAADGSIEGRVGGANGTLYFTISVDNLGTVTFTQVDGQNVWHGNINSDDDTSSLVADVGTIELELTLTDADGDSRTASIDLSDGIFHIEDDGPTPPTLNTEFTPELVVDESPVGQDEGGDNAPPGDRSASQSFAGAFLGGSFGTDGPLGGSAAEGTSYALLLSGEGASSGLYALDPSDTSAVGDGIGQGEEILLYTAADGSIEGRVGGANGTLYFTITVNDAGLVTFTQVDGQNVWHGNTGSDDDTSYLSADAGTILLEQTLTDADGDTDSATIDLSDDVFQIEDDGPTAPTLNREFTPELVVDESPVGQDEGGDNAPPGDRSASQSFAGAFLGGSFGTDGPLGGSAAEGTSYALLLSEQGASSGLYALDPSDTSAVGDGIGQGEEILLYTAADGSIEGRTGGANGTLYFTITVNDAGLVTFTQEEGPNIWHGSTASDDDTSYLSADAGTILLEQTLTDADGDTDSATIDLSDDVFQIEDDGPSTPTLNGQFSQTLVVDESPVGQDEGGDNSPPGDRSDSASFAGAFGVVTAGSFGTDGPLGGTLAAGTAYSLDLSSEGAGSGLYALEPGDTSAVGDGIGQGAEILLYTAADGSIEGRVGGANGTLYFTISVSNTGTVTFNQVDGRNVWHANTGSDDDTSSLVVGGEETLALVQTLTDADGDTASNSFDLSDGIFRIEDDGPDATNEAQVAVAEGDTVTGTFDFVAGTDGGGVTHINGTLLVFGMGGWSQSIDIGTGSIRVQADGDYEFTAEDPAASGPVNGTFTVTDTDGDTETANFSFNITDANVPTAGAATARLDDDGLANPDDAVLSGEQGDIDANVGEVPTVNTDESVYHGALNASFGGDGPGAISFAEMDGDFGFVGTERVVYSWNALTLTLQATVAATSDGVTPQARAGTPLFQLVMDGPTSVNYTLTLQDNVLHADDGNDDEASAPDVVLNFTITDSDSPPGGGVPGTLTVTFNDDIPTVPVRSTQFSQTIVLDESPAGQDEGGDNNPFGDRSNSASFAGAFGVVVAGSFGADGPLGGTLASGTAYALDLSSEGANSGLYALDPTDTSAVGDPIGQGAQIQLYTAANGSIEGRVGGPAGTLYFTISVDNTGTVTFTQEPGVNVWHGNTGSDDDTSSLVAAANTVTLVQTLTDADGDSASNFVDLSNGVFQIEDDGPKAPTLTAQFSQTIVLDESPAGQDEGGDNNPFGDRSNSASFAGAFGVVVAGSFGTDGPLGGTLASGTAYALDLSSEGAASGLYALDPTDTVASPGDGIGQGSQILLYTAANGSIEGRVGGPAGTLYFTISVDNTGTVTFTQEPGVNIWHANTGSDDDTSSLVAAANTVTLVQTLTDADGDSASNFVDLSNGVFQIEDDGPKAPTLTAQFSQTIVLDESPAGQDEGGDNNPFGDRSNSASFAGAFGVVVAGSFGTDGPLGGTLASGTAYALDLSSEGAASGLYALDPTDTVASPGDGIGQGSQILLYTAANGSIEGRVGGPAGTLYFTISVDNTGTVTFTQEPGVNIWHANTGSDDDTSSLVAAANTVTLVQTLTDADGDSASNFVDLSNGVFQIEDDGPKAPTLTAQFSQTIVLDESPAGQDEGGDNNPFGDRSNSASFAGAFGVVVAGSFGTDGPLGGTLASGTAYALDLSSEGAASGLYALDPTDTVASPGDGIGQGSQILLYTAANGSIEGRVGGPAGTLYFTISVDNTGTVTFTQEPGVNIWHANTGSDDDTSSLVAAANTVTLVQTLTDADGDSASNFVDLSNGVFQIEDDGPTAVAPAAITTGLTNGGNNSASANLDGALGGNNVVSDNFGTDGGRVIFTTASITHLQGLDLKFGGTELTYVIGSNGQLLTGFVDTNLDGDQDGGETTVFTIQLQTGVGGNNYTVTMVNPIDTTTTIDFNDGSYDFVGGNDPWAGFTQDDVADSPDLLITPFSPTGSGNSINGNANSYGTGGGGAGQNVGENEGIRLDFVTDLTGNPAGSPANYDGNVAQQDHAFDGHYNVNDVSVRFDQGTGNSTTRIEAFDMSDANDLVLNSGTLVGITRITISYDGEAQVFNLADGNQTLEVGSVGGATNRNYTVNWIESLPGSGIYYVNVIGIMDIAVRIATHVPGGYEALELENISGGDSALDWAISGVGIVTSTAAPIDFTVPVSVIDGDGDTAASGNLAIHADPIPPVVLDMDGDGVEFLGLNAGVQYDYGAGLVATAWAGADDAILVRDANGDGTVTDASEFVFGGNGVTDMEALHAQYGDQLDASDADFTMFALWTDANSNGVVDAGEMQSLAEAGIVSIGLVSDGASYSAAEGDVSVAGSSTYTMADGSTGTAADAAFAIGGTARNQEVERVAANSNTTVLAAAVAAAGMAASAAASAPSDNVEAALSNAVVSAEPLSVAADLASSSSVSALAASITDGAATVSVSLGDQAMLAPMWHASAGDIGQSEGFEAAFSALAAGTDVIASQMTMPAMATTVAMPAPEAIMALENSPIATIDTVEQILVDALAGGGMNQIDALMNALPDTGNGGISVIDSAASGFHGLVPSWDMGGDAGFTTAVPTIITAEAMMLHVDAIQPAANG